MPTTGTVNGRLIKIFTDDVAVTCLTNATIEMTMEPRESTCKDDSGNAASFLAGRTSWTMGGEGKFAFDSANGFSELYAFWLAGTEVDVSFQSTVAGDKGYEGSGFITSLSADTPDNEDSTFSFTIQGSGALSEFTTS
jgi:predicted secreted protein